MDELDPFGPQPVQATPARNAPLQQQWGEFLSDPRAIGALASFGLNLMGTGKVDQAIGAMGTSVRTTEELDRKQQELGRKEDLANSTISRGAVRDSQREDELDLKRGKLGLDTASKQRELDIKNRRTDIYGKKVDAQTAPGTLTDRDKVRREQKESDDRARAAERESREILRRIDLDKLEPTARRDPSLQPYYSKTPGQIADQLQLDPNWRKGRASGSQRSTMTAEGGDAEGGSVSTAAGPRGPVSPVVAKSIDNARAAIAKGWPREAVIQKLEAAGITPPDDL